MFMAKFLVFALLIIICTVYAGTNCEIQCCKDYKGKWDNEWDRCWKPQPHYEECVSNCTAQTIHYYSGHIDKSDIKNPIVCKIGAVVLGCAVFLLITKSIR